VKVMKVIHYNDNDFAARCATLDRRAEAGEAMQRTVAEILAEVRGSGDAALFEYGRRFDGVDLSEGGLAVGEDEFAEAEKEVDDELRAAVAATMANTRLFAEMSLRSDWKVHNHQGAEVGEVFHPFGRVGIYVPGGTAPLVSTAMMTVPFARAAGVQEIVVSTPCGKDGKVNPALLYALKQAGATEVYKCGGAQAIAALAHGTESIRAVEKVYGPGNAYVVEAKRQVFGVVAVDLLPGPSEVMVLADGDVARADWVAADLLAQAEHGKDSVIALVTSSEGFVEAVEAEIRLQARQLSRQQPLAAVLEEHATAVVVRDLSEGVDLVNAFAPEHLSLVVSEEDEATLLPRIRTSGAIYVGGWSAVAIGDFLAGPSHELPTGGAGKSFPGLTAEMFQRRTSVVRFDRPSVEKSLQHVEAYARVEGLDAHGQSVRIRLRN